MSKTVLLATEKPFSQAARKEVVSIIEGAGYTARVLESYKGKAPLLEAIADAAVLVGLVPHAAGTTVLLTRRTDALRNHAGQVSFPGGRVEPDDADAIAAALRETGEEIGVPVHQISPIGLLDPLMTITGFRVLPVVAMIDRDYVAVPDPGEVAEVFEVPLAFLVDPANLGHHHVEFGGRRRRVLEFRYPAQRIWGVTASILWNLRKRLEETR